jgi:hypothetical protein
LTGVAARVSGAKLREAHAQNAGLALGTLLAASATAMAQNYPTKPITMIIPFAAGGPGPIGRVMAGVWANCLDSGRGRKHRRRRRHDCSSAWPMPPDGYTFVLASVGTHAQGQTPTSGRSTTRQPTSRQLP